MSLLLVNQHTVPLFIDIANAFAVKYPNTVLFTGYIEEGDKPVSQSVRIVRSFRYNRKNSFTRLVSWLGFTFHYFLYLLLSGKPERILVVTNPPMAPIITAYLSGIRNIPFYILIYDLYPDALFQAGFVRNRNVIFRVWSRINRWVFRRARKIFTLSESMKAAASRYVTGTIDNIKVINNWADSSYIRPISKHNNIFVQRHGLEEKIVVLYAGNMGHTHDLESLIDAADILREIPDLIFILVGDGAKRKRLEQIVNEKSLKNVLFLPYQNQRNFPLAMAAADIGVVTLGKGAEGISVPSKTYVNLAAGLCILGIAPGDSELSRLITEHDAGVVCEPGQHLDVVERIRTLAVDNQLLKRYKENALRAAALFTPKNAYRYVEETVANSTVAL